MVDIQLRFPRQDGQAGDFGDLPAWSPPASNQSQGDFGDFETWSPEKAQQAQQQQTQTAPSIGQAIGQGITNTVGFGLGPTLQGLSEVSGDWHDPIVGATKMLLNSVSSHPDPEVRKAYEHGRAAGQADEDAARETHPWAYFLGQLGGTPLTPAFGALRAGGVGARAAYGAIGGAAGGALYGAGTGLSQGEDIPGIAKSAGVSGVVGGAMGGTVGGILGQRINPVGLASTPGQRAATTAADLGKPLPRGLVSDNPIVQATTAKLRSFPVIGSYISNKVGQTAKAAGERIGEITGQMAGGAKDRAAADTLIKPALDNVIQANKGKADVLYNSVRSQINPNQRYTLPQTEAMLDQIMAERANAGWSNPAEGLEQFRNVAAGGSFNGTHRARVDARNAGSVGNPHPGYDKNDFNRITQAMTADLRNLVHTEGGSKALDAFDKAETEFGKIADQNEFLANLRDAGGRGGAIAPLLGAASKNAANVQVLADLKKSMNPADFQNIGGVLLHELGQNSSTGEFSLAKFVTGMNDLSPRAKGILFSPQHLKDIENIAGMGEHIKRALTESNTSHTANAYILFDILKDIALTAANFGGGSVSGKEVAAGMATTAVPAILGAWLASPAKAASMSAFAKAYRGVSASPTPARAAMFNLATRNLANNLGIPAKKILERAAAAQPQNQNAQPDVPGELKPQ